MQKDRNLQDLFDTLPQVGCVEWIGVRPARGAPLHILDAVQALASGKLEGDRYSGGSTAKRQVTLIQHEHLQAVASMLGKTSVDPAHTRRNLVVSGINLLALHNRQFAIGEAILEGTGYCQPCSRMEETLGPGGYNAMRGHGGITARIVQPGLIRTGDAVRLIVE